MLQFGQTDISAGLIMTLTEKVSISTPNYLMVFTHVLTRDTVAFVLLGAADESPYRGRYNKYTVNPSVLFVNKQPGEWHYKVYEQASAVNIAPALSGAVIEVGKMMLNRGTEFEFEQYNTVTTYKTYNG